MKFCTLVFELLRSQVIFGREKAKTKISPDRIYCILFQLWYNYACIYLYYVHSDFQIAFKANEANNNVTKMKDLQAEYNPYFYCDRINRFYMFYLYQDISVTLSSLPLSY